MSLFETPGGRREIPPYRVARPKRRKSPFPLSSNACSPNQASFESETSDRNHKAELASHPPSPFPVTSGRRCPSHPASFHSPRAFKSWSARPAPSSAASSPPDHLRKRPTDRPTGSWRATAYPLSREAAAARELRGRPAGTRCQTGPVPARVSTLSHRRGQENRTRRPLSRTSLGEVRRPDGREEDS